MFETGGPLCPVLSFEKYLSHLNPKNKYLFQRPKKIVRESDKIWYDNMVVGECTLADKMKKLSSARELSHTYTNHSIRATAITILDDCGFEARHIMAVSGHRSEQSTRSYASRTSLNTKRKMSETISSTLDNNNINNKQRALMSAADSSSSSTDHGEIALQVSAPPHTHWSEPLLTASQEEYMNEMSIHQSSSSQQTINYYNCTFINK